MLLPPFPLEYTYSILLNTSTWRSLSYLLSCSLQNILFSHFRSMGNRPQGSRLMYTSMAIFFALVMGYMLFCSVWLSIKGVQATIRSLEQTNQTFGQSLQGTVSAIASNPIFRDLILSTAATYGLYLISSLLFLDFLHMFTSLIQYLLFSPSYVNILYTSICSSS